MGGLATRAARRAPGRCCGPVKPGLQCRGWEGSGRRGGGVGAAGWAASTELGACREGVCPRSERTAEGISPRGPLPGLPDLAACLEMGIPAARDGSVPLRAAEPRSPGAECSLTSRCPGGGWEGAPVPRKPGLAGTDLGSGPSRGNKTWEMPETAGPAGLGAVKEPRRAEPREPSLKLGVSEAAGRKVGHGGGEDLSGQVGLSRETPSFDWWRGCPEGRILPKVTQF